MARLRRVAGDPERSAVRPADAVEVKGLVLLGALALFGTPPARVQVVATEYNLALSRPSIKAGEALVQLVNFGEDPHDLRLQRIGGKRVYRIGIVNPGGVKTLEAKLLPGSSGSGARSRPIARSA